MARDSSTPGGPHPSGEGRPVVLLSALAALLAGVLSSAQSRANGELAHRFGTPVDAALSSFTTGWVVLLVLVAVLPRARAGLRTVAGAVRSGALPAWATVGGLLGGFFVAVQTVAVPTLGVALFTVGIVGGQTTNALLVDRLGLGPAGRVPVTRGRVVAALLTFVGVAVAAGARGGGAGSGASLLPLILTVLAGAGMALQQALNGRVNQVGGHVVATSVVNFTWGLGALLGWAALLLARGSLHAPTSWSAPWWAWTGGLLGIVFVAVGAVVVRHLGVLVAALLTLSGQLVSAVLLDLVSPTTATPVDGRLLLGVALTLVAALGAGVAAQRARRLAR